MGGAGVQADIKTCEAFGCFSATAITALTAQNTNGVSDVFAVTPEFLDAQIKMITNELKIDGVKVGMLFNEELIKSVKTWLERFKKDGVPIVIDPVCVAKSGAKLLQDGALSELKELLNLATIATPNLAESQILGLKFEDLPNLPCDIILKRTNVSEICEDTLYTKDGETLKFSQVLQEPAIMHGAGCSFASALACELALGLDLRSAINLSKRFISNAVKHAHKSKFGVRLLNHKMGANG